jgi:hypothetical protein
VIEEGQLATRPEAFRQRFGAMATARVVIEMGAQAWVGRLLGELGYEGVVANPRRVKLVSGNDDKSDGVDAACLARLGRADVKLLFPVVLRSAQTQADREVLRAREALVRCRTPRASPCGLAWRTTGSSDLQLRITKDGNPMARRLLVTAAHPGAGQPGNRYENSPLGQHECLGGAETATH